MYGLKQIDAVDLRRIFRDMRCNGLTESQVIERVCWILKGLTDDDDKEDF